jgi:hypothetical protein
MTIYQMYLAVTVPLAALVGVMYYLQLLPFLG